VLMCAYDGAVDHRVFVVRIGRSRISMIDLASWLGSLARAFGGHSSRPLRASKLSSALSSKTLARCLAFSSGHTSTVDSVPSGSIRMTCHPKCLSGKYLNHMNHL
jgi:hypothetical protein